tara:strand:+ start:1365 stop:1589 length:225 start_codon:yes stop_codon:yes gene_type:complete
MGDNNNNNLNHNNNIGLFRSKFSLKQSQPYVLTSEWPNKFIPNGTIPVPDLSLEFLKPFNSYTNNKYHIFNNKK